MKILSIKPESLIEWPGHLSYVIFLAGCNFRCPFCYVPDLILPSRYKDKKEISIKEILEDIKQRTESGWIDAICITGGEPTLNSHLPDFLKKIKQQNIKIRLETNGSNPEMVKQLIKENLIDSIALDIKNSKNKYIGTAGVQVNLDNIEKTLKLIKNSHIDYELRTTIIPGLHNKKDILDIAEWLYKILNKKQENKKNKIKLYILQQFRSDLPHENILNPEFQKKENYPIKKLKLIKKDIEHTGYFEKVEIRGQ